MTRPGKKLTTKKRGSNTGLPLPRRMSYHQATEACAADICTSVRFLDFTPKRISKMQMKGKLCSQSKLVTHQKCQGTFVPEGSQDGRVHGDSYTRKSVRGSLFVACLLACLTSKQNASVFQGRICSGNFTCCHTEIEVADQTFHLTQSQYTDTVPTSPSTDPLTPGAWQGSHWSANV